MLTALDPDRLLALDPAADLAALRVALHGWETTCEGGTDAATGRMRQGERFRWMVAPRSTIIQPGPVHMGLTEDPVREHQRLLARLVA